MQIEIHSPSTPADDYTIYKKGETRPIKNMRKNITGLYQFSEDDIENLLEHNYNKFTEGKYQFNVSSSRLKLVTGERSAQTRAELELYP